MHARPQVIAVAMAAAAALSLVAGEVAARLLKIDDVPLFRSDPSVGYYPAPTQKGRFLRQNDWAFNDRSMGVAAPFKVTSDSVLLIGDSVVYGGNPFRQADKLGPTLARTARRPVWPVAAGGWALENELRMLRANPDLLRTPTIVFVSNTGDFGAENGFSEAVYPSRRPVSALGWAFRKYVLKARESTDSPRSGRATEAWEADLRWFLDRYHGRLVWVLYPQKAELRRPQPQFAPLLKSLGGRATIVDVKASPRWTGALYRDGVIHPTPEGDRVLASIIAASL